MAVEQYANLAQDQLNGGIDNVVVSLDLDDASEFPATGNFRILIDSELLICTARTSNTLTVVRGQEGTVAASHSDNAIVTLVATAGSILAVGSAIHRSDVVASRPAAGLEGRLFFPTAGRTIDRDNGTLWTPYGPTYTLKEPIDGDFAWINQGGASVDMSVYGFARRRRLPHRTRSRSRLFRTCQATRQHFLAWDRCSASPVRVSWSPSATH
jgi:hypothetical protein